MRRSLVLSLSLLLLVPAPARAADAPRGPPRDRWIAIAPRAWAAALEPLARVRRSSLDADVVALEDVLGRPAGGDAPERVKRFLYEAWRSRRARYALLVGDSDAFPVRFMVLDRVTAAAFDYAFYPSDLYYADVARPDGSFDDWNANTTGFHAQYVGEVQGEKNKRPPINLDGVSYVPEVAVGRWPASNLAEVNALVEKAVGWESRARAARRGPSLWLHTDGWVDARERLGGWADRFEKAGRSAERQFYGGRDGVPNPASVMKVLGRGADWVFHAGHGSAEGWPGCLSTTDVPALTRCPPAVYVSAGCDTAVFAVLPPYTGYVDVSGATHRGTNAGEQFTAPPPPPAPLQPAALNPSSFGERVVKTATGGAIAYIGCDTGAQPCALTLVGGLAEAIAAGKAPRLGDAWNAAIAHYVREERLFDLVPTPDWYPPSVFFQGMKFVVFGDPALPLP